jgi:hypothetical protein
MSTHSPVHQIVRTTNWNLPAVRRFAGREDEVSGTVPGDRRVMCEPEVSLQYDRMGCLPPDCIYPEQQENVYPGHQACSDPSLHCDHVLSPAHPAHTAFGVHFSFPISAQSFSYFVGQAAGSSIEST